MITERSCWGFIETTLIQILILILFVGIILFFDLCIVIEQTTNLWILIFISFDLIGLLFFVLVALCVYDIEFDTGWCCLHLWTHAKTSSFTKAWLNLAHYVFSRFKLALFWRLICLSLWLLKCFSQTLIPLIYLRWLRVLLGLL